MSKTVIALYDDFSTAQRVVEELVNAGFDRSNVSIIANNTSGEYAHTGDAHNAATGDVKAGDGAGFGAVIGTLIGLGTALIPGIGPVIAAGPFAAALMAGIGAATGAATGGISAGLIDLGIPEDEAGYYAEGLRRGGAMVSVNGDDTMIDRAANIMNTHNPVDLEKRGEEYRSSGWTGYEASATPYSTEQITNERSTRTGADVNVETNMTTNNMPTNTNDQMKIDVVEEELHVGKREVEKGAVRVRTYVTEKPVQENLTLREEHVNIERRPVDRPASTADLNAFQEGTIEMTERAEVPVVSKEARVVEEVVIGKEVQQHTETISDTVRRTDVEVEHTSGMSDMWRQHYTQNYGSSGRDYDYYMPAYQYGYGLRNQYSGQNWTDIEPHVRTDWESRNQGSRWEDFQHAIRHGWENMTGQR